MTPATPEATPRPYDVAITVQMPGQTRVNTYHLRVMAMSISDALWKGQQEWIKITEPRDVQVRESVVIPA